MTALNVFFIQKEYRNRSLHLLCHFIQSEPPHLHVILETRLFGNILQSLQHDDSTSTISLALANLILLLPNMPSSLIPHLPTLFNIYARLLFWDRDRSFAKEHAAWEVESPSQDAPGAMWEKCLFDHDLDGNSIPYLSGYFTILYGLYPINFVDYIRKPQRYLRHANNEDDIDVQATEIRDRSEQFRRRHLLHPNFYSLTIESEKTDLSRWIKSEASEVAVECMALCIGGEEGDETRAGLQSLAAAPESASGMLLETADSDTQERPLLRRSVGQASSSGDSQSSRLRPTPSAAESLASGASGVVRRSSQSSHPSVGEPTAENRPREIGSDSPTLPAHLVPSSSHTQLQDMIHSNKVIKSGLHQSHANDSVPSLSLNYQEPIMERSFLQLQPTAEPAEAPGTVDMRAHVARLHQRNLLLQIDLDFERYMKQQHMAYVGELRRKQLREAATEAEAQNLIMVNRSMKHRLEEAKKAELQVKKQSDLRRNMSKRLEADLTSKLRALREEQKKRKEEEAILKQDLEDAREECQRLRKLITDAEESMLKSKQDSEAMDLSAEEIAKLKAEVTRLSASERRYQGKESEMQAAIQEAADADARAEMHSMKLAAYESELQKLRESYESRMVTLNQQRAEALESSQTKRDSNASAVLESALAASRAKQTEMQKQFSQLTKKYALLQSSLATVQRDAAETRAVPSPAEPQPITEPSPITGSSTAIRNKPQRGFSDPETFDATSYNPTPPLEPVSTSFGSGFLRPSTPPSAGAVDPTPAARTSPQAERYHGRGRSDLTYRRNTRLGMFVLLTI